MGQIVFVKLFAPVSLQAPVSGLLVVERVRFTGSLACGQERPQRNRPPGGLQESIWAFFKKQNCSPVSFYFKIGCTTG